MGSANIIHSNVTLTTNGNGIHRDISSPQVILFWNILGPITGSSPGIQFTMQEVDPGDEVTRNGQLTSSSVITTTGTGVLKLNLIDSPTLLISWTLTGGSPSFGGVYLSVVSKMIIDKVSTGLTVLKQLFDIQSSVIYLGTAPQGSLVSDPVWLIKKTALDTDGSPLSTLLSSNTAIWNNRTSETYQ